MPTSYQAPWAFFFSNSYKSRVRQILWSVLNSCEASALKKRAWFLWAPVTCYLKNEILKTVLLWGAWLTSIPQRQQQFSWSDSLSFQSPTLLVPSCSRVELLAFENKYFSMYICYYRGYCENLKELSLSHLKNLIKNYWMNPFGYCGTKESSF